MQFAGLPERLGYGEPRDTDVLLQPDSNAFLASPSSPVNPSSTRLDAAISSLVPEPLAWTGSTSPTGRGYH